MISLDTFPIIFFNQDTIDLGVVSQGDIVQFYVPFANIGEKDLEIELVTSCKCTDLQWPLESIPSGFSSKIFLEFDSSEFSGEVIKVVDIIANTEYIVTELWFRADVIKASD